jgi:hypothetical protein
MTTRSDEAEALLARLHNNHVHKFVARSDEELRAHIAAAIDAARVPSERGKHREKVNSEVDLGDDDGPDILDLEESAPAPAPADGLKTPSQAARRLGISYQSAHFAASLAAASFGT